MIDSKIEEALLYVSTYAYDASEWKIVKQQLLRNLPPEKRKFFSRRDPVTKIQNFNEFEGMIVERWKEITGNQLIFRVNETSQNKT